MMLRHNNGVVDGNGEEQGMMEDKIGLSVEVAGRTGGSCFGALFISGCRSQSTAVDC